MVFKILVEIKIDFLLSDKTSPWVHNISSKVNKCQGGMYLLGPLGNWLK